MKVDFRITLLLLLAVATAAGADDWHRGLYLGRDGYWRARLPVDVASEAPGDVAGMPVAIAVGEAQGQADLVGATAESVRVCDVNGVEMLYSIIGPGGDSVTRGTIQAGSTLMIPVECLAGQTVRYWVYFDNSAAWPVADHLPDRAVITNGSFSKLDKMPLTALPGAVERIDLEPIGVKDPWSSDAIDAVCRVPVRSLNMADQPLVAELCHARLDGIFTRLRGRIDPDATVVRCGDRVVPHRLLGDEILYEVDIPPKSVLTCWVYVSPATAEVAATSIGSILRGNLVKNPGFEAGRTVPDQWTAGRANAEDNSVAFKRVREGRHGDWCAKTVIPTGTSPSWYGWHQNVMVEPGRTYLYAAWVRAEEIEGAELRLHGHCYRSDGKMCEVGGMTSVGAGITGFAEWTLITGFVRMPADAAEYRLHLTFNGTGIIWYDDVVVQPMLPATAGRLCHAPKCRPKGLAVWNVNPIVKVFREDVPADLSTVDQPVGIAAAGRESEPVQLAIRSDVEMSDLHVVVDPPTLHGAKLDDFETTVVGYVPVDYPTSYYRAETPAWHRKFPTSPPKCDGWAGWWPDPLLPRDDFDLVAGQTQPIWVTFHVTADARPGDYTGAIRLTHNGRTVKTIPLTVHVHGFTLPKATHLKAIYDVRFRTPWSTQENWAERAAADIWPFMARRRLSAHEVVPSPKFEYREGVATADFSSFDEAAEHYFDDLGMTHAYSPWHFYGFGWGHPPRSLYGEAPFEGDYPYTDADRSKLRPQWKSAYQACLRLFWDHIRAKGWSDRFTLYISDEPHYDSQQYVVDQMKAICEMIHEVDREIPIYSSTWGHLPDWDGYLDVWGIGHYGRVSVSGIERIRETGAKIWFTTDGQMCLDTPYASTERLLAWFCYKYGAEAYEFWGVAWHTYDPYKFGWHSYIHQSDRPGSSYYVRYPNGDGYLIYPPLPGESEPVSTIRLEQARDGVEDYEYLYLLKQLIDRAKAAGVDASVGETAVNRAMTLVQIPNAGGLRSSQCLDDPDAVFEARAAIARAIEVLSADTAAWERQAEEDAKQDFTTIIFDGQAPNQLACDTTVRPLPDGSWVTVMLGGGHTEPLPANRVFISRSRDQGRTWTAMRPIDLGVKSKDSSRALTLSELMLNTNRATMVLQVHNGGFGEWKTFFVHSDDSCHTWSALEPAPGKLADRSMIRNAIKTRDGRVLMPYQHYNRCDEVGHKISKGRVFHTPRDPRNGVIESRDGGRTWKRYGDIRLSTDDNYHGWAEPNIVELSDGTIAMIIRADGLGGVLYHAESKDGGHTWPEFATKTTIPNPGSKATLYSLGGDTVAMLHNPNPRHRSPLALWISFDGMTTWPYRRVLVPESCDKGGQINYPDGFVSEDGEYLNFVFDDNRHRCVFYRAKLPPLPLPRKMSYSKMEK